MAAKKRFRIETVNERPAAGPAPADPPVSWPSMEHGPAQGNPDARHQEVMEAIARLEARLGADAEAVLPAAGMSPDLLSQYKSELKEAARLKSQMDHLQEAVRRTQAEIKAMQFEEPEVQRLLHASEELEEVVAHNEHTADTILTAAETIGDEAERLAGQIKGTDATSVYDIQEQAVAILQACNFHDLTGQRITKVVRSLKQIEERLENIRAIWGEDSFEEFDVPVEEKDENQALLHGPALPTEEHCSQDDIDALFD